MDQLRSFPTEQQQQHTSASPVEASSSLAPPLAPDHVVAMERARTPPKRTQSGRRQQQQQQGHYYQEHSPHQPYQPQQQQQQQRGPGSPDEVSLQVDTTTRTTNSGTHGASTPYSDSTRHSTQVPPALHHSPNNFHNTTTAAAVNNSRRDEGGIARSTPVASQNLSGGESSTGLPTTAGVGPGTGNGRDPGTSPGTCSGAGPGGCTGTCPGPHARTDTDCGTGNGTGTGTAGTGTNSSGWVAHSTPRARQRAARGIYGSSGGGGGGGGIAEIAWFWASLQRRRQLRLIYLLLGFAAGLAAGTFLGLLQVRRQRIAQWMSLRQVNLRRNLRMMLSTGAGKGLKAMK